MDIITMIMPLVLNALIIAAVVAVVLHIVNKSDARRGPSQVDLLRAEVEELKKEIADMKANQNEK